MAIIYNVDTEKEVTPLMVRDAILDCFYQAHCEAASLGEDEKVNRGYCGQIVKKAFADTKGNFEKPSKEDILNVMEGLKEFAKGFRNSEIIQKHAIEIMKLIEKLK